MIFLVDATIIVEHELTFDALNNRNIEVDDLKAELNRLLFCCTKLKRKGIV
jgi:hypothetical protein